MARKRMISPEIWTDRQFGKLDYFSRLVFIGLISMADDEGRGDGSADFLITKLFASPKDRKEVGMSNVEKSLYEIGNKMGVIFYQDEDNVFYQLKNWEKWQTINRPSSSSIPKYKKENMSISYKELPIKSEQLFSEHSVSIHGALTPNIKEVKLKEVKLNKKENNIKEKDLVFFDDKNDEKNELKDEELKNEKSDLIFSEEKMPVSNPKKTYEKRFEIFWEAYGNKKGSKIKARQFFITRKISEKTLNKMLDVIKLDNENRHERELEHKFNPEKPYATTWLNGKRWITDEKFGEEESEESPSLFNQDNQDDDVEEMAKLLKEFEENKKKKQGNQDE